MSISAAYLPIEAQNLFEVALAVVARARWNEVDLGFDRLDFVALIGQHPELQHRASTVSCPCGRSVMVEKEFGIEIDPTWQKVPGNDAVFKAVVRQTLAKILQSDTGKLLARSLRYHKKTVLLQPYEEGDCNAKEWWWGDSAKSNYSVVRFGNDARGSSACAESIKKKKPGSLPQEVLFHELVHSLRRVSGQLHNWNLKGGYGNNEEFTAILVTNIFISDVTNPVKSGLRADWVSHSALDPKLADSFRFFAGGTKIFNLIATFCDENAGFTKLLSRVRARFNPIAAYYRDRRKAFEMAAQGDSENYFEHMTPMDYVQNPEGAWTRIKPFPHN
jgi:hypothetical protein